MQNELAELIETTYQLTGISTGLIEKDYYITRLISHLAKTHNDYFNLF